MEAKCIDEGGSVSATPHTSHPARHSHSIAAAAAAGLPSPHTHTHTRESICLPLLRYDARRTGSVRVRETERLSQHPHAGSAAAADICQPLAEEDIIIIIIGEPSGQNGDKSSALAGQGTCSTLHDTPAGRPVVCGWLNAVHQNTRRVYVVLEMAEGPASHTARERADERPESRPPNPTQSDPPSQHPSLTCPPGLTPESARRSRERSRSRAWAQSDPLCLKALRGFPLRRRIV